MPSDKNVEDEAFHIHFMERVMFSDRLVSQRRRGARQREFFILIALVLGLFICLAALN